MSLELVLSIPDLSLTEEEQNQLIDFEVMVHHSKCWLKYWMYNKLGKYKKGGKTIPSHLPKDIDKCFNLYRQQTKLIARVC